MILFLVVGWVALLFLFIFSVAEYLSTVRPRHHYLPPEYRWKSAHRLSQLLTLKELNALVPQGGDCRETRKFLQKAITIKQVYKNLEKVREEELNNLLQETKDL